MSVEIREISTPSELKKFIKFGIRLYKNNPYYIPPLIDEEVATLRKDKNPAFEEGCEAKYFMAYKNGKPAGVIAGIINYRANRIWNHKLARFGFVDFVNDEEVSEALFHTVEEWARSKGMKGMQGPMGFTDFDHQGMLTYGFDQLGTMATIYNYEYYPEHLERLGFTKGHDALEYKIWIPEGIPEKHIRISELVMKKYGLAIRKFKNKKEIMPYAHELFELLNKAYAPLENFVPLSQKQIDYYVNMYIPLLRYENVVTVFNEETDEMVGVGICIPSLAKAMQKAKGKFLPFGFIHLLKALKGKNDVIDLYLVAVAPEYQSKGVNALLFYDLIPVFIKNGYEYAESNPELETNERVQSQWEYFERVHHKSRRIYIKMFDKKRKQKSYGRTGARCLTGWWRRLLGR